MGGAAPLQRRRQWVAHELRRKAAEQASRNLYGPLEAGGLSRRGRTVVKTVEARD